MASQTQMVVGKGKSIPLIAEGLLKILGDLIPPILPKSLIIPSHGMVGPQKVVFISPVKCLQIEPVMLTLCL